MRKILLALSLLCYLLLNIGIVYSADTIAKSIFLISSVPEGASVFHYLRGKNYFLGYTPLEISKKELNGKDNTKIRLIKFGYKQTLLNFSVNGKNKLVTLEPEGQLYLENQSESNSNLAKCSLEIEKIISDTIRKNITSQLVVQLPFYLAETDKGVEIGIMMSVLNHCDIRSIQKIERRNKGKSIAYVERLVSPVAVQLINLFEKLECLDIVAIVADYQGKGLKVDFTPYRDYWSRTTVQTVGRWEYTRIVSGSTIELHADMIQTKKHKSFLFKYKLH